MRVGGMAEYWRGGQVRDREVAEAGLYRGFRVRGKFFRLFHVLFLVSIFTFGPSEKFISSFLCCCWAPIIQLQLHNLLISAFFSTPLPLPVL